MILVLLNRLCLITEISSVFNLLDFVVFLVKFYKSTYFHSLCSLGVVQKMSVCGWVGKTLVRFEKCSHSKYKYVSVFVLNCERNVISLLLEGYADRHQLMNEF